MNIISKYLTPCNLTSVLLLPQVSHSRLLAQSWNQNSKNEKKNKPTLFVGKNY